MLSFQRTSGGEGPARTTCTLTNIQQRCDNSIKVSLLFLLCMVTTTRIILRNCYFSTPYLIFDPSDVPLLPPVHAVRKNDVVWSQKLHVTMATLHLEALQLSGIFYFTLGKEKDVNFLCKCEESLFP